ncbi:unnamed protein product [Mycena citricolor]|uniref:Uncharacterized protein n=1 Tax=Mycena citricolor TaxID=2018698 RepID=A0AAD2Q6X8_9AGAR|nr:unnamed protein product [Mycena citricolor]CAK5267014.1 unnamed protein product [Mycena citricolor]CAK5282806.1 unnamed protein product [Mycena citricolor]
MTDSTQVEPTTTTTTTTTAPVIAEEPHKKHGVSAIVDKIIHPHGHAHHKSHEAKTEDVPSVPVAVPQEASDGPAHMAPAGSAVGGVL